jgi:hypothetical protein
MLLFTKDPIVAWVFPVWACKPDLQIKSPTSPLHGQQLNSNLNFISQHLQQVLFLLSS